MVGDILGASITAALALQTRGLLDTAIPSFLISIRILYRAAHNYITCVQCVYIECVCVCGGGGGVREREREGGGGGGAVIGLLFSAIVGVLLLLV